VRASTTTPFGARFVVPLLIGPVLNPVNTTMVSVALVPISAALGVGSSTVVWLVAGLYLASSIAQPTMGTLADRFGPRRTYLVGLAVVVVAGVVPLVSATFAGVLVSRVLLGIGTSAAYPSAMTMIRDQSARAGVTTPPALLSAVSIAALATTAVGPVLGGFLVGSFGWPAVFVVNVPLAGIALVLSWLWLPGDDTRPASRLLADPGRLDVVGMAGFAVTTTTILVFLLDLASGYWWLLAGSVLAGALTVRWELRRTAPFIDLRMLRRNGALTRTYLRMMLLYFGFYSMTYGYSQWLQDVAGFSSERAGLLQLPSAVLAGLASVLVARTTRLRAPLVAAGVLPALGGVLLVLTDAGSPVGFLLVVAGCFGIAQGLASVSNQAAMYRQAPPETTGAASGLSRTFVYLAAIGSSALVGLVFGQRPTDAGLHLMGWVVALSCLGALALAVGDRTLARRTPAGVG
jgi:MFS family permease